MSVITKEDHIRIVRKIRKRAWKFHAASVVVILALLVMPIAFKLERDLAREAYGIAKMEFDSVLAKQEMLRMLRTKPMTVGQALDVVDVVMTQREVPISIVLGVMSQESEFNPKAVSKKGARGLMQMMPDTFKLYAQHPLLNGQRQIHDPVSNVSAGLLYLADLLKQYGDWKKVLRVYQAGDGNVNNKEFDWYANAVLKKAGNYDSTVRASW